MVTEHFVARRFWLGAFPSKKGKIFPALATFVCVVIFMGLLVGVELYLEKRNTAVWMEKYHIGLFIVLSMSVITYFYIGYSRMMSSP